VLAAGEYGVRGGRRRAPRDGGGGGDRGDGYAPHAEDGDGDGEADGDGEEGEVEVEEGEAPAMEEGEVGRRRRSTAHLGAGDAKGDEEMRAQREPTDDEEDEEGDATRVKDRHADTVEDLLA
jgi:hypothetical protein